MKFNISKICTLLVVCVMAMFALLGCDGDNRVQTGTTAIADGNITEQTVKNLQKSQPTPVFTFSQERENLIKRLNQWNSPDTISYIALLNYGKTYGYYTVKGKVSSLNSLLTNPKQIVQVSNGKGTGYYDNLVMDSPDLDGSYGDNPKGVFFWTAEANSRYIEWTGDYLWSSQPLNLQTPPEIITLVKDKH